MADIDVRDHESYREISISGGVQIADLIAAVRGNYTLAAPPRLILYDLSGADLRGLKPDDLRALARATEKIARDRDGGRTAIVAPRDLEYGLLRMFTAYTESSELTFQFGVFKERAAAFEWLGIDLASR